MRLLKTNAGAVAAKVIDGEAIIMNLANGAYYSMDGAGSVIWEGIEQSQSIEEITRRVCSRYSANMFVVRADIDRLVNELLAEGLIEVEETTSLAQAPTEVTPGSEAYASPVLNKYTEMADLLALDPPMPSLSELPTG